MKPNPYLHAGAAAAYIALLVLGIANAGSFFGPNETMLIPMAMLALLVLSVSVMALLFFYQPVALYLEGRKQDAFRFFLKTVGAFACLAFLFAAAALLLSFV